MKSGLFVQQPKFMRGWVFIKVDPKHFHLLHPNYPELAYRLTMLAVTKAALLLLVLAVYVSAGKKSNNCQKQFETDRSMLRSKTFSNK